MYHDLLSDGNYEYYEHSYTAYGRVAILLSYVQHGKCPNAQIDQGAPILSLACSGTNGIAAGTELTNHQAAVSIW